MQRSKHWGVPLLITAPLAGVTLIGEAAHAHHLIEVNGLAPTAFNGLLSGLAHPVLGPDHLVFLLALSLVGLQQRRRWMLGLLLVGMLGCFGGLLWPALPGAELLVALTLVLEALTLLGRMPVATMLPAMALHGYVLSASVLGWNSTPITTYMAGLLISQGLLLLLALVVLQRGAETLSQRWRQTLAAVLTGLGGFWAISQVLA